MKVAAPKDPLFDKVKRKALNHPVIAAVAIIMGTIVATSAALEASSKLLVFIGIKPDALSLAGASQRSEFSRQLTRLAWYRLSWARAYASRVKLNAAMTAQDDAWNKYIVTVEDWSAELVNNYSQLREYHGSEKFEYLRDVIHPGFDNLHTLLLALRYPTPGSSPDRETQLSKVDEAASALNVELCGFVTGLPSKKTDDTVSACF